MSVTLTKARMKKDIRVPDALGGSVVPQRILDAADAEGVIVERALAGRWKMCVEVDPEYDFSKMLIKIYVDKRNVQACEEAARRVVEEEGIFTEIRVKEFRSIFPTGGRQSSWWWWWCCCRRRRHNR